MMIDTIVVNLPPEPVVLANPEPEQQDHMQEEPVAANTPAIPAARETDISTLRYSWFNSKISSAAQENSEQKKKDQGCSIL